MDEWRDHQARRPDTNPLPAWGATKRLLIASLQTTMANLKNNIHFAQWVTKAAVPTPFNVSIVKIHDIPRRKDVLLDGLDDKGRSGYFSGEWVVWDKYLRPDGCLSSEAIDAKPELDKIILFAHDSNKPGGAFCLCTPKTHRGMTWRLSKYARAKVLSIKYRLAPKHPYPAALHDMISAYLFLIDPPNNHIRYHPSQIIFAGDSAGGNLSVSTCYWLHSQSFPLPGGIVGLSPWLDLSHSLPSFILNDPFDYLPNQSKDPKYISDDRFHYLLPNNDSLQDQLVSPLFGDSKNLACLPPTLIQVGDAEKLRDEGVLFALRAEHEGNKKVHVELYEDMVHVFHMFCPLDTLPKLALKRAGEFIRSLDMNQNMESRGRCSWIRQDSSIVALPNPLQVLNLAHEKVKYQKGWTMIQENTFQKLVSPLMEL